MIAALEVASPLGPLTIEADNDAILRLTFGKVAAKPGDGGSTQGAQAIVAEAGRQLNAYFEGDCDEFTLPVRPDGTHFQQRVWQAMCRIDFGETRTYGEIAAELSSAARAVGGACGENPIPIIVPCHRVVGANGWLGGFSGGEGPSTKRYLLDLESTTQPRLI